MSTLTTTPLAGLLERLFEQAEKTPNTALLDISEDECSRLLKSKTEYLDLYSKLKELWLPVSRESGRMLYMLARSTRAKTIIEFGTSFGISTLHLAAALRDNGGGRLITTESEESKVNRATQHFLEGGLIDLVEIRQGDALITLSKNLPQEIDLVLLDGAKSIYLDILNLLRSRLRSGAIIVADNTNFCPDYIDYVRNIENGFISVQCMEDIELSVYVDENHGVNLM